MGSSPNLVPGQIPTAEQWNGYFAAKADDPLTAPLYTYLQPTTGQTILASSGTFAVRLDPVAELAALTVAPPVATLDGQLFRVSTTQTIDALTPQAPVGQVLVGATPFTLGAGGGAGWWYRLADNTWRRDY